MDWHMGYCAQRIERMGRFAMPGAAIGKDSTPERGQRSSWPHGRACSELSPALGVQEHMKKKEFARSAILIAHHAPHI